MRWGVRDEATDDHMTSELCMKELKNCQKLSTGPNFIVSIDCILESKTRQDLINEPGMS